MRARREPPPAMRRVADAWASLQGSIHARVCACFRDSLVKDTGGSLE